LDAVFIGAKFQIAFDEALEYGVNVRNRSYLFVYGSLRKPVKHSQHHFLAQYATFSGKGTFRGRLYDLGRYPGAIASRRNSERVVGELYRIRDTRRVFKALDDYEGKLFKRKRVLVLLDTGVKTHAWTYLYTGSTQSRFVISSGDYVEFLKRR
jgi:gamma-glutamylcyclotransferase (GGCT)/AIG2-like uncharacterized protein YtfP